MSLGMDTTFLFAWFVNPRKSLLQSSANDTEEKKISLPNFFPASKQDVNYVISFVFVVFSLRFLKPCT